MSRTYRSKPTKWWVRDRNRRPKVAAWWRRNAQKRYRAETRDKIRAGCYDDLEDPRHLTHWFDR